MLPIESARLQLLPCSEEVARLAVTNRAAVAQRLALSVPDDWPTADLLDLLPLYADWLAADPAWFGWGVWLIVHRSTQTVIGDIGFKGPPDDSGTVEIGYGVLPAYQCQGYATEAAQALVSRAFEQPQVQRVVAECLADNTASARVLAHVGMQPLQPAGQMLKWELRRAAGKSATPES